MRPLGAGAVHEGTPGWQSSSRWDRVADLLDGYSLPRGYGDVLRTGEHVEMKLHARETAQQEQRCQQAAGEAAWPLLQVMRDLPDVKVAARRGTALWELCEAAVFCIAL